MREREREKRAKFWFPQGLRNLTMRGLEFE